MALFNVLPPPPGSDTSQITWLRWFAELQRQLVGNVPLGMPSYLLAGLPPANLNLGKYIDVSNATGGPKLCRSNGTNWIIANTATVVS